MAILMWSTLRKTSYILLLSLLTSSALAAIGTVTDQQGPDAKLVRDKDTLVATKGADLEMQDAIETRNTKLALTFEDDTKVAVTEQSKFIIDEFIYDPNAKKGSLNMRVAMGTVRYASGNIAKNSSRNVRLRTPTATVSVRGTDFAMVVNEVGQSMVTLLPSCPDFGLIENKDDENNCPVGEIQVSTDAGFVVMNQAYQTTVVSSAFASPTKPRILTDRPTLSNLLIIAPPYHFPKGFQTTDEDIAASSSFLETDFLEFDELMQDLLANDELEGNELDRDQYGGDFLDNLLELTVGDLGDAMEEYDGVLPTIHKYPWIKGQSYYNEEGIFIRSERIPHTADVTTERDANMDLVIIQDGVQADLLINGGADVTINIIQTQ